MLRCQKNNMTDYERGMWAVLKHRLPNRIEGSLHIREEIHEEFELNHNIVFRVFFAMDSDEPMNIDICYE